MSIEYPVQTRAIDPYSSYNSNIVNRLTRLITRGTNCLHGTHAIDVYMDATATNTVRIIPGQCFKDDVIISINEEKIVDITHTDYYINHLYPWNEAGYYWICLEYVYAKAKPAPQARIRILKPSQHHLFDESGAFLFLKAADVQFNGLTFELRGLYDYDPSYPAMKRIYAQLIAGVEDSIPEFIQTRDEARLIYVRDKDELYFGTSERWESFNAIRANINTTLCEVGQLAYLDVDGKVHPALSTSPLTHADCGVIQIGQATNGDGKVRLYGLLEGVPIEPGRTIQEGENVYLSATNPGCVTDLIPANYPQFIGTSITPGDATSTCDIWFLPTRTGCTSGGEGDCCSWRDVYEDLLLGSIYKNLFCDSLANVDFIDTTNTTATLVTFDFRMEGDAGDKFYSLDLAESGWSTPITTCQLASAYSGDLTWYVNNSLTDNDAWESADLNKMHYFSEVILGITPTNGTFSVGEKVTSSMTNKIGYVEVVTPSKVYLSLVSHRSVGFVTGEQLTGETSGATATINTTTSRESNNHLRVRVDFGGATGGIIYDYGILYCEDEDLVTFNKDYEKNVDTLYLDVYTDPQQFDNGLAKLSKPLETQIQDLETDTDSKFDEVNDKSLI